MIIAAIIAGAAIIWAIAVYNGLVSKRNTIESTFSTIDVMLKKRYDLIPNLVAAVRGYSEHESATLARVTELRNLALKGTTSTEDRVNMDNEIGRGIASLLAVAEGYPELKAAENFMHLQRTLNEVEEQLSAARRTFNAATTEFNNTVEMFPSSLIARLFKFTTRPLFEIDSGERAAPAVDMAKNKDR